MERFRADGHLTDEALLALIRQEDQSELERLEIAEHLAFCDACLQRYTDLLAEDALLIPSRSCQQTLWQRLRVRAVRLALTVLWGSAGIFPQAAADPLPPSPDSTVTQRLWDWPERWNQSMDSMFSQISDFLDHFSGDRPQTNEGGTHS